MNIPYPDRIVCLTEETTEILYLLGCGDRVVGISGFTMRPPQARLEKPKVSTFLNAKYEEIVALKPDLVLAFSDLQAEIAKEFILRGLQVVVFNQRSLKEILQNILVVGGMVGKSREAELLVEGYEKRLQSIASKAQGRQRPKVYFEEWGDPLISGIRWVSELIEVAGGEDIFGELRNWHDAKRRIVQAEEVIKRNPDIIIGSWCGRPFKKAEVVKREGWERISAVRTNRLYEMKSTIILQPGPAALTDGLDELVKIIQG
ncbi:MAG TPA: cobalamin-binding protein [Bacteroidota bacterium]|nr:cobalamin-binding protein [Bacteroidota bacterium]